MGLRERKFLGIIMERSSNYTVAERRYNTCNISWLCRGAVE